MDDGPVDARDALNEDLAGAAVESFESKLSEHVRLWIQAMHWRFRPGYLVRLSAAASPMLQPRELAIENARQCAREQLDRFGVRDPDHIDVEGFASYLGVTIMTVKLDGADAQLIRTSQGSTMLISDRLASPQVRRFTVAHELGHLLLEHPTEMLSRMHRRSRPSAPLAEVEANAFASELLMPAELLRETCDLSRGDLVVPREISQLFNVSILAAAIRYTELSREPCAAVFSIATRGGETRIRWVARSNAMEEQIRRGCRLSPSTLAASFFRTGKPVTESGEVPVNAWIDGHLTGRVIEHVVCAPSLRTALSMVWIQRP